MQEFQVLGITLKDYSAREAMKLVENYMSDGKISTVCYLTAGGLLEAENHPETKDFLGKMDLTVAAQPEVLTASSVQPRSRIREVENNDFLRLFLHRMIRGGAQICLLSDSQESLMRLKDGLLSYQAGLRIVGTYLIEGEDQDIDTLINDINVAAPHVLISDLSYPLRERFFTDHHMKLHAQIWLMLQKGMAIEKHGMTLGQKIRSFFDKRALRRTVDQYRRQEEKQEEEVRAKEEALLKFDTQEIDTQEIRKALGEKDQQI